MTTTISHSGFGSFLRVECPGVHSDFICYPSDINRKHEGVWNSRVFAFVPEPKFSDGVPVAAYEQFITEKEITQ